MVGLDYRRLMFASIAYVSLCLPAGADASPSEGPEAAGGLTRSEGPFLAADYEHWLFFEGHGPGAALSAGVALDTLRLGGYLSLFPARLTDKPGSAS